MTIFSHNLFLYEFSKSLSMHFHTQIIDSHKTNATDGKSSLRAFVRCYICLWNRSFALFMSCVCNGLEKCDHNQRFQNIPATSEIFLQQLMAELINYMFSCNLHLAQIIICCSYRNFFFLQYHYGEKR